MGHTCVPVVQYIIVTAFHHSYTSYMECQKHQLTTYYTSPLGRENTQSSSSHHSLPSEGSGCLEELETEDSESVWPLVHVRKKGPKGTILYHLVGGEYFNLLMLLPADGADRWHNAQV